MDTSRLSAFLAAAVAAPVLAPVPAAAQPSDLFPDPIPVGGFAVPIRDFARVDVDNGGRRFNLLAPDPTGRLFANAQEGELYRITPGTDPSPVYFNLAQQPGVQLRRDSGEQGFQSFAFHPEFATTGAGGFRPLLHRPQREQRRPLAGFHAGVPQRVRLGADRVDNPHAARGHVLGHLPRGAPGAAALRQPQRRPALLQPRCGSGVR